MKNSCNVWKYLNSFLLHHQVKYDVLFAHFASSPLTFNLLCPFSSLFLLGRAMKRERELCHNILLKSVKKDKELRGSVTATKSTGWEEAREITTEMFFKNNNESLKTKQKKK